MMITIINKSMTAVLDDEYYFAIRICTHFWSDDFQPGRWAWSEAGLA